MNIGYRIAQLRESRGWSHYRLACCLGTNTKSIKDWESNISMPSLTNIVRLCKTFHITADELMGLSASVTIVLDNLPQPDQIKIRAMLQAYIDACETTAR